jgi:murein DD-endopeptidase MepM/ murein hydrolase activator NlpD
VTGRRALGILTAILVIGGAGFAWIRGEGDPPDVAAPETILLGRNAQTVALEISDAGSGVRSVEVILAHPRGEEVLLADSAPGTLLRGAADRGPRRLAVEVAVPDSMKKGGEAFLRVVARDWSLRGALAGNEIRVDVPVTVDLAAPRISVETGLTYVRRGGAATVVYSVSEPTARDGVVVGEAFFRGYPLRGRRVAYYAVPTDATRDPEIRVVAEDAAGNESRASWPVVVKERKLPAFEEINTRVRGENEARVREIASDSADDRLWQGPFEQLANSKVTSRFAERRTYLTNGKGISHATHFGYDLATTRAAPVTAANGGRVLFADDLGIYGNCVLVDHGQGIVSLYGHLSRIDVTPDDRVERGQVIGLSGMTGLAGGDHLHFAILVGDTYVDPLEWWDPKWVRTNIEARIAAPPS